jgi:Zn-dependent protease with chaperone function
VRHFVLLAVLVYVCVASPLGAQSSQRDATREKRIEDQLSSVAPLALPNFKAATRALDAGNLIEAGQLYRQVLVQAPDFSPAMRRLGGLLVRQGSREEGLNLLARTLSQERSPENLISMAQSIAYPAPGKEGTPEDMRRALALVKEASAHPAARADSGYLNLHAFLAMSLHNLPELRTVVESLRLDYPNEAMTHYCAAIMHAIDSEWIEAEQEIRTAERLGFPHDATAAFLASGVSSGARMSRFMRAGTYALAAWACGLIALFFAGRFLSAATLRSIDAGDPSELASSSERSLRRIYRALIRTAAIYYYVSLPFVGALVLAVAAAVFYGFTLIGRIPIQLAAALAIGAVVTLYRMVHSLFVRIDTSDPGRSLTAAEAPGLWRMTRAVAQQVGTRTIDDIRVTPGTDLAVYERGTARERKHDQARRTLILGIGVLNGFSQGAFRAVLAHEYGHFAHRDTAGGDQALRVSQDMMKFAIAMANHGQAVWWNVAFQFLRLYHFIFRRISHGATRLQEVMADRVAAHKYGADQFEQGLRHVIRSSIEFEVAVTEEINDALRRQRPCQNLYTLVAHPSDDIEHRVQDAIDRPTTEDDTHPGPSERFRLVSRIPASLECDETGLVWDLFVNREGLTKEMTAAIESTVQVSAPAAV